MFFWHRKRVSLTRGRGGSASFPIIPNHQRTIIRHENRDFSVFHKKYFLTRGRRRHYQHHQTISNHLNRDFNIFYKKCSFDPADIQASKQFILARLFSTRKRINWASISWKRSLFNLFFLYCRSREWTNKKQEWSQSHLYRRWLFWKCSWNTRPQLYVWRSS